MSKTKKVSNEININNEIDKIMELYKSKQINNYVFDYESIFSIAPLDYQLTLLH
jgi:hypothetical protein